jgi:hypothetical protein
MSEIIDGIIPSGIAIKPAAKKRGGFQKGVSGNPLGRKRVPPEIKEVFAAASIDAARRLVELMGSSDEGTALKACNSILDRHLGRPAVQSDGGESARLLAFFGALQGVAQ